MRGMLAIAFATFVLVMTQVSVANANCVCRCVDGQMQAICSNTMQMPPNCPMTMCPTAPPTAAPMPSMRMQPHGTTSCSNQQVLNPYTGQYEWKQICR